MGTDALGVPLATDPPPWDDSYSYILVTPLRSNKELRHHAARFYADYLPAGRYHLSYTTQAIAAGEFSMMPVHAEEMYDPDVFGKGSPAKLVVQQK